MLNPKLLSIAALLLVVLALLFLATPLIRPASSFQRGGNIVIQGNGQSVTQNGSSGQGTGNQFFIGGGGGSQSQVLPVQGGTNLPARRFVTGSGLMGGRGGIIVYFIALLVSLAAAVGMFIIKRWGQVLGIIMAVLYTLLGLVSLLPIILMSLFGMPNPVNLILGIVRLLLAIAVIVLASIPAKPVAATVIPAIPPAVGA